MKKCLHSLWEARQHKHEKMKLLFLILFFVAFFGAEAQNVSEADFNVVGNTIEITYKLDEIADIEIYCSTDGGRTFGAPLENVSGDVGANVMPGNKTAVWHVYADLDYIYSDNVSFKIKVKDAKKTFDIDGYMLEMVKVNGGSFEMGDVDENVEMQPHEVYLNDFYIAKYEVTVELFKKFIDATNYKTDADKYGGSYIFEKGAWILKSNVNWRCDVEGEVMEELDYNRPVIHVSRNDALAFCAWLKQKTGESFKLPTEAEWNYAAIGGDVTGDFMFAGSDYVDVVAWHRYNSCEIKPYDSINYGVHDVGLKYPNELGLYDMTGNVSEWCNDIYGSYAGGSQMNPIGKTYGELYVIKGGSWIDEDSDMKLTKRTQAVTNTRRYNLGFRVAL